MGYVIALCIVVLAAFVCTAVVLVRDGGERSLLTTPRSTAPTS